MNTVVAIDGPGSSGKNSVGLGLSKRLGFQFIDSGSIYRAVAYYALQKKYTADDSETLASEFATLAVRFVDDGDVQRVFLGDEDMTSHLHTSEVTRMVPIFAKIAEIRIVVREKQHALADARDIVMAGRDTGTVIFPEAPIKFYVTASPEIRAKRRYDQLVREGIPADYDEILTMLIDRDAQDSNRPHSPLKPADDAVMIDTSDMSVSETVEKMYGVCKLRLKLSS
jgi:cytidylate kinase